MAEVLGPMSIALRALPTGVDGTKLAQWKLHEGVSVQQFVALTAAALGGINQEFVQKWGYLFSITDMDHMEYPDGGAVTELQEITDMDDPDMVHGTTIGHMLDLRPYGGSIGGSRRYFRDARQSQIESTLRTIVNRAKWRFERKILTRLFTNTENAIGSAGYDVPFVRGTGGSVDYAPPAYGGETFTTSHDHFLGVDDDTLGPDDVLNQLAETLDEHGHTAPFTALVSKADVASYRALTKFVQMVAPIVTTIDRGGESSGNQLYASGTPMVTDGTFGYFQSDYGLIELKSYNRVPTKYASMVKSYGQLDARNPLAVRIHPDEGFGLQIFAEKTGDDSYPLKKLNIEFEFGVGVGEDRTNGAAAFLDASGNWSNPTIG